MSTEAIRKRLPFRQDGADEDRPEDQAAMLDEEEQDALLRTLTADNEEINWFCRVAFIVVVGLVMILRALTLTSSPSSSSYSSLFIFTTLPFSLLVILLPPLLSLAKEHPISKLSQSRFVHLGLFASSSIPAALEAVRGRRPDLWSLIPVVFVGGCAWMESWISEIASGLRDLEKKKYGYKGA